jgi:hypothetical protein
MVFSINAPNFGRGKNTKGLVEAIVDLKGGPNRDTSFTPQSKIYSSNWYNFPHAIGRVLSRSRGLAGVRVKINKHGLFYSFILFGFRNGVEFTGGESRELFRNGESLQEKKLTTIFNKIILSLFFVPSFSQNLSKIILTSSSNNTSNWILKFESDLKNQESDS